MSIRLPRGARLLIIVDDDEIQHQHDEYEFAWSRDITLGFGSFLSLNDAHDSTISDFILSRFSYSPGRFRMTYRFPHIALG